MRSLPTFEGTGGTVKQGTATADEFRFCRAWWEVHCSSKIWLPYTKTSTYSPFWDEIVWVGNFAHNAHELKATGRARVQGIEYFGKTGVTYTSKSVLGFNPRLQPGGCAFGHTGSVAFGYTIDPFTLLGFLGSRPVEFLLSLFIGELQGKAGIHPNHYEVGTIQRLPWPGLSVKEQAQLASSAKRAVHSVKILDTYDEITRTFVSPVMDASNLPVENADHLIQLQRNAIDEVCSARREMDEIVAHAYGFSEIDKSEMDIAFVGRVPPAVGKWRIYFGTEGADLVSESESE
jgi:hypothetical protein